jgi:hypothetical protein
MALIELFKDLDSIIASCIRDYDGGKLQPTTEKALRGFGFASIF